MIFFAHSCVLLFITPFFLITSQRHRLFVTCSYRLDVEFPMTMMPSSGFSVRASTRRVRITRHQIDGHRCVITPRPLTATSGSGSRARRWCERFDCEGDESGRVVSAIRCRSMRVSRAVDTVWLSCTRPAPSAVPCAHRITPISHCRLFVVLHHARSTERNGPALPRPNFYSSQPSSLREPSP